MMIELEDVAVSYGTRVALDGISARFEAGQLVSVAGPNGSGKSTLLKVMARVVRAGSGCTKFDGKSLDTWKPREFACSVSYLQQETSIAFPVTALDLVLSGLSPFLGRFQWERPPDVASSKDALALCDALDLAERDVGSLSGGEKKRVFLARALVSRPAVLLLDEPLSGLDVAHVESFMRFLRGYVDSSGATAILASHDLNWCSAYSDRMVILQAGRIARDGKPQDVMTSSTMRELFGFEAESISSGGVRWVVPRPRVRGAIPAG